MTKLRNSTVSAGKKQKTESRYWSANINKFGTHKLDKCILTSEIRSVCSHIASSPVVSGLTNWFSDHLGACVRRFTLHRRIRITFEALNFCDTSYQFSLTHPSWSWVSVCDEDYLTNNRGKDN